MNTAIPRWLSIPLSILVGATLLHLGRAVFVPLAYSVLLAFVLYPLVKVLENLRLPRSVAIGIALTTVLALFVALLVLLAWQVRTFMADWPALSGNTGAGIEELRTWLLDTFGIGRATQDLWLGRITAGLGDTGPVLGAMVDGLFGAAFNAVIIPIFTALILYNRKHYVGVLSTLTGAEMASHLPVLLQRSVHSFARFIVGMVQVYAIVGLLNSVGLMLLGVPNAWLFGLLCAIMTIIPYVGIILSSLLPISVAWMTTGSIWAPLGVVALFAVVQYLEANLIFPKVVGRQLGLTTMASLVLILVGGAIWGVSGMVLFLPYAAIVKLLADDIPGWKPLSVMLSGPEGKKE
jgi:predicted PurR-regulated permease PerM